MCPQILVKLPTVKYQENPFSDSRVVTNGQTDGHGEFNRRILQLTVANAPMKLLGCFEKYFLFREERPSRNI
jgi:hypothetical protein